MELLKDKRIENRYSYRLISKELGMSYEWYRTIETNNSLIKIRDLRKLIPLLNLTNEDIIKIVKGE